MVIWTISGRDARARWAKLARDLGVSCGRRGDHSRNWLQLFKSCKGRMSKLVQQKYINEVYLVD